MSEIGKKLSFPQTSQIPDEATRVYARKLTRVLDEMRDWLLQALQSQVTEITNNLGVSDHGELAGLEDVEDHLYAFLHDGSRPFTAYGPGFTNDTALSDNDPFKAVSEYAIKAYVDALLAFILASPVGSIIYVWEDAEGDKYLERLTPGQYGQVLTTAGANHPPFWAWVYEEPGAVFSGEVFIRVWMYAYVWDASIITMDVLKTIYPTGLDTAEQDCVDDPDYFTHYLPQMESSVYAADIITMDKTKTVQAAGWSSPYMPDPTTAAVSDAVGVTDAVEATIPLAIAESDDVGLTDYTEGAVS